MAMEKSVVSISAARRDTAAFVAPFFEMQGLYNRHADAHDASSTASHIPDNSLVFIEGTSVKYDSTQDMVGMTTRIRDHYGVTSSEYKDFKAVSVRAHKRMLDETDNEDFSHYAAQLAVDLAEKDCAVYRADLLASPNRICANQEEEHFLRNGSVGIGGPIQELTLSGGLDKAEGTQRVLKKLIKACATSFVYQHSRESIATDLIALRTHSLIESGLAFQLSGGNSGQVQTSVVYGSAHARSLTSKIKSVGFEMDYQVLNDMEEHRYLEEEAGFGRRYRYEILNAVRWLVGECMPERSLPASADIYRVAAAMQEGEVANETDLLRRSARVIQGGVLFSEVDNLVSSIEAEIIKTSVSAGVYTRDGI